MHLHPALRLACFALFTTLATDAAASPVPNVIPHSAAAWSAQGSAEPGALDDFGSSVAAAGDVNGDGYGDVIIGAPGWNGGRGRVLLYLGSANGLSSSPAWSLEGGQEGGILGNSVASAGDVNRDGYSDILVGELGYRGPAGIGRVRLFLGSRRGPRSTPHWEVLGQDPDQELGFTVASAGDVNGDGYDDILIGSLGMSAQSVRLYLGRPGRLDRDPEQVWTGGYVGEGVGDVNGDGLDDLALELGTTTSVFHGSRAGLASVASWVGPSALSFSGRGDVDGDGFGDLLLGPATTTEGVVRLYRGSGAGLSSSPVWSAAELGFGSSVGMGDVNRDGLADVAVSAPQYRENLAIVPSVFVYLGARSLPSLDPSWRGTDGSRGVIRPVALGADVDGDGSSEVLFADPEGGSSGSFSGRVYLYRLGPAYPAPRVIHEAATSAVAEGSALTLEADILDSSHYVARAEIRYRFVEDFEFQPPIAMERIGENRYRGTIPAPSSYQSGLVYSIRGVDDYGLTGETVLVGVDYLPPSGLLAARPFTARGMSVPGNSGAEIRFTTSRPGHGRVQIYDAAGHLVATLLDAPSLPTGEHWVDVPPSALRRSGVYFYRVESSEGVRTGRLVHVR